MLSIALLALSYNAAPRAFTAPAARAAVRMQEIAIDVAPAEADKPLDLSNEAPPEQTRFKAIALNALDEWAERFPRLKPELQDIQRSALIFPFKASPYLVEELIDWEMEGDIKDDPFYRLVFPTMEMLAPHHRETLQKAHAPSPA